LKYEEESKDLSVERLLKEDVSTLTFEKRAKITAIMKYNIMQKKQVGMMLYNNIYKLDNKMEE